MRHLETQGPISFRCYYKSGNHCDKIAFIELAEIEEWIYCYKFTHPDCTSISIKLWFKKETNKPEKATQ